MGQAKLRGSREKRVAAAVASVQRLRPEFVVCGKCNAKVTELEAMDTRSMDGIVPAFAGKCPSCNHVVRAFSGEKTAVANAILLMQELAEDECGIPPGSLDTLLEWGPKLIDP